MKQKIKKVINSLNRPAKFFWAIILIELLVIPFLLFFNVSISLKTNNPLRGFSGFLPKTAISNDVVLDRSDSQNKENTTTNNQSTVAKTETVDPDLENKVLPKQGVELPVRWNDLGKRLVERGVIDQAKLENIYSGRGGLSKEMKDMLTGTENGAVKITSDNAGFILNLLWALGLGNKNEILEKGEMSDPQYGGAGNFASTGGWSLSVGKAMDHYSKYPFITLTTAQQKVVDRVSRGIYRPCCGNSTHFPDCNHGMAMLALLELLAAQGTSEDDMYRYALKVNAYWFPDTYLTIATYLKGQGNDWEKADPKQILGADYSSALGYQKVLKQTQPVQPKNGGAGCGV